jgi:hypothetical protein
MIVIMIILIKVGELPGHFLKDPASSYRPTLFEDSASPYQPTLFEDLAPPYWLLFGNSNMFTLDQSIIKSSLDISLFLPLATIFKR